MFSKIGVLKCFVDFTGKHLCFSLFLIKSQASGKCIKKSFQHRCFPVKLAKFSRAVFLKKTSGGSFSPERWNTYETLEEVCSVSLMSVTAKERLEQLCSYFFTRFRYWDASFVNSQFHQTWIFQKSLSVIYNFKCMFFMLIIRTTFLAFLKHWTAVRTSPWRWWWFSYHFSIFQCFQRRI